MKASSILGLNARSQIYSYRYNTPRGRKIARSKLLTKRVLRRSGIPIPRLYSSFKTPDDIIKFNWEQLPSSFALKPSKGLGGDGIIVIKKRDQDAWISVKRERYSAEDLKLHAFDILEGAFSVDNAPDVAFVEEYVGRHKSLQKFAFRGTPDVRVIIFNKVPVMAMLRLPTKESGGRANLHQGAIGVGIDIATGITTRAIWHGKEIVFKPGTKRKLHGIKIPKWDTILEIAVRCQVASHLGYVGVDIVLHPERGPMVLEINSQPGLQIQLANKAGLRRRLERVDELEVKTADHGVKIAKALFAQDFADRVMAKEGIKTIHLWEPVKIVDATQNRHVVKAKVDTGAWRSSIDRNLAESLGLTRNTNVLWTKTYKSGLGKEEREAINLIFYLAGRRIRTVASVADRSGLRAKVIIGRRDLSGFLVRPRRK